MNSHNVAMQNRITNSDYFISKQINFNPPEMHGSKGKDDAFLLFVPTNLSFLNGFSFESITY